MMGYAYEHEFIVIHRVYVRSNSKNPEHDKVLLEQGVDRCINSDKYEHLRSEVSFVCTKEIDKAPDEAVQDEKQEPEDDRLGVVPSDPWNM